MVSDLSALQSILADRLDLLRVGIMPDADRLYNKEAKRIANETDFLVLGGFDINNQNLSPFNKITSILFK